MFSSRRLLPKSLSPRRYLSTHEASRTVAITHVPPSFQLNDVLKGAHPPSAIEAIRHIPEKKEIFISFLNPTQASLYLSTQREKQRYAAAGDVSSSSSGPVFSYTKQDPLPVEIVAAVGLRNANRTIRIYTPAGLPEELQPLEKELGRFGPIEQVVTHKGSVYYVTFLDITTAIRAVKTLRVEAKWEGLGIGHAKIRNPWLESMDAKDRRRSVLLRGLPEDTTYHKLGERIKAVLPFGREYLTNLSILPARRFAFFNFVDPAMARIFYDSYQNPESTGGVRAEWSENAFEPSAALLRAVKLGASRTIRISNIQDVARMTPARIRKDFSKFGDILTTRFNHEKKYASVTFANIYDAMSAIDRIHENNRNFRAYAGTYISFSAHPEGSLRPLHILTHDHITSDSQSEATDSTSSSAPAAEAST